MSMTLLRDYKLCLIYKSASLDLNAKLVKNAHSTGLLKNFIDTYSEFYLLSVSLRMISSAAGPCECELLRVMVADAAADVNNTASVTMCANLLRATTRNAITTL